MSKIVELEVKSKGLKYLKVNFPGKTCSYSLIMNPVSEKCIVGGFYKFLVKQKKKKDKFGTTVIFTPLELLTDNLLKEEKNKDQIIIDYNKNQIEKFLNYIEDTIDEYWYTRGECIIREDLIRLKKYNIDTELYENKLNDLEKKFIISEAIKEIEKHLIVLEKSIAGLWKKTSEIKVEEYLDILKENDYDNKNYLAKLINLKKAYTEEVKRRNQQIKKDYDQIFTSKEDKYYCKQNFILQSIVYEVVDTDKELDDDGYIYIALCKNITNTTLGKKIIKEYMRIKNLKLQREAILEDFEYLLKKIERKGDFVYDINFPLGKIINDTRNDNKLDYIAIKRGINLSIILNKVMSNNLYAGYNYLLDKEDLEITEDYINLKEIENIA